MIPSEFIAILGPMAQTCMKKTNILSSVTIAQGILESGWGTSQLCTNANALFGIKAGSTWSGNAYHIITKECYDGATLTDVSALFRAYDSWEDSVVDHGLFIAENSRYKEVVGETDYIKSCQALQTAGYATATDYASKLITLIQNYNLTQFDTITGGNTMTNSKLVTYTRISPNSTNPRTKPISKITIHCMAGNLTVESCGNIFADSSRGASSHYGIGSDGRVALYVEEKNRAWTTGGSKSNNGMTGSENDQRSVTIEVANCGGEPDWPVTPLAMDTLVDLVEDIARRNNIYPVTFTGDSSGTLTAHRWFAAKACPGDYLYGKLQAIAEEVTARLTKNPISTTVSVSTSTTAQSSDPISYTVEVTDSALNIRSGAGTNFAVVGKITDKGIYTITQESTGYGATRWGKLKSGLGWISLDYCNKK